MLRLLQVVLVLILSLASSSIVEAFVCRKKKSNCALQSKQDWAHYSTRLAHLHSNETELDQIRPGDINVNPYFFAFGFPKAGTTTLYALAIQHPDIPSIGKELNWWLAHEHMDTEDGWEKVEEKMVTYFKRFPKVEATGISGDWTILSATCGRVAPRLHDTFPAIKLVAIMREPVARAISQFNMCTLSQGWPKAPFNGMSIALEVQRQFDAIQQCDLTHPDMDPVDRFYTCHVHQQNLCHWGRRQYAPGCHALVATSSYYFMIEKWRRAGFDIENQMLLLSYEEMSATPQVTMDQLFAFLGVKHHMVHSEVRNSQHNKKIYRPVDLKMMQAMRTYYEPHNALLYELTGQDFGWHYAEEEKYYDAEMNGYGISETKVMDPEVLPDFKRVCKTVSLNNCIATLKKKYIACEETYLEDYNATLVCVRLVLEEASRKKVKPGLGFIPSAGMRTRPCLQLLLGLLLCVWYCIDLQ